jgi:hypothetical protein
MPARLSGAPPRQHPRRDRGMLPRRARAARLPGPQPRHAARPHATWHGRAPSLAMRRPRARAGCGCGCGECKSANNSGALPAHTSRAQSHCRARLACYPAATQRATQHSGNSRNYIRIIYVSLGGATETRTPDLLHAMKSTLSPPPALTRRDQPKQRRRATRSDGEQRPQTLICYPARYPGHARSALPSTDHAAPWQS